MLPEDIVKIGTYNLITYLNAEVEETWLFFCIRLQDKLFGKPEHIYCKP